jgi:hypothetical protein
MEQKNEKLKPVHVRAGNITISVWNGGRNKPTSITLQRSYKNKDGEWQNSAFIPVRDIPIVIEVLRKTYVQFQD